MRSMLPLIGIISTVAIGCDRQAPAPVQPQTSRTIRLLAYNVQLLPLEQLNKRPDEVYRTAELGKRLAKYDVVGLSELFQAQRRRELLDTLRTAWQPQFHSLTAPELALSPWGLDGGLALVGRLPIVANHWRAFGNGSSPIDHGLSADGFANKGILHARLRREAFAGDDAELDLFLTHLESRESSLRDEQYVMLGKFMAEHVSPKRPALLLGDLNTDGGRRAMDDPKSQYHRLLAALQTARPNWIDIGATIDPQAWNTFPADEDEQNRRRIDFIFVADSDTGLVLKRIDARVELFADPRVEYLSDHAAVAADLEW